MLICNYCGGTHAPTGGKNKRTETCVFNLMNPLFMLTALCTFMLVVRVGSTRRSINVKYSNIEKRKIGNDYPR